MINNRNKSVVRDMKWNASGTKICIVYEDGAVIVGSVDGNRLWGKDLDHELALVEWSPSSNVLLFCSTTGECYSYDSSGVMITQMRMVAADAILDSGKGRNIVALEWYKGCGGNASSSPTANAGVGGGIKAANSFSAGAGVDGMSSAAAANPTLAIGFDAGKVQLMRSETDPNPIVLDVGHRIVRIAWSPDGSVLAIAGYIESSGTSAANATTNIVEFFSPTGAHMRTLRVPGSRISAVTWEGDGLRIALAVDSFIYFANIRKRYRWSFFNSTLVYSYRKSERADDCVMFWDTRFGEKYAKYVKNLETIAAAGEHCALLTRVESNGISSNGGDVSGQDQNSHIVILCNAIGSPVDSRYLSIKPHFVCMTRSMVVVADAFFVYRWSFETATGLESDGAVLLQRSLNGNVHASGIGGNTIGGSRVKESVFHIDELRVMDLSAPNTNMADIIQSSSYSSSSSRTGGTHASSSGGSNSITALCVSSDGGVLVVAREDCSINRYTMRDDDATVALDESITLKARAQQLSLNCDATRVGVIDVTGTLTQHSFACCANSGRGSGGAGAMSTTAQFSSAAGAGASRSSGVGTARDQLNETSSKAAIADDLSRFERRDCWDFRWSSDDPSLLVSMEKGRMYIFRDCNPEEPVSMSGYLCEFRDLEVRVAALDSLMRAPSSPDRGSIFNLETKSLRDTRDMLGRISTEDAYQFIEENSHPRLWRLLAEHALHRLDLPLVDKAFVRCGDYHGIQLAKKLREMTDEYAQRAEVASYFKNFEEAEAIYRSMDRMDLAIAMRIRLGDWFKVEKLVQQGHGDDSLLSLAWNKIGEYYADRRKWNKAVQYFAQARNTEMLVQCLYALEDYKGLEKLIGTVPEGSALLSDIGEKFLSVGLCSEAVAAYVKAGDVAAAVQACVMLSQWDVAVSLAHRSGDPGVLESTQRAYKQAIQNQVKPMQAVALYRKTGMHTEAAQLLVDIACKAAKRREPPMRVKKIFVLAALEIESFRRSVLSASEGGGDAMGTFARGSSQDATGVGVSLTGLMALSTTSDESLAMQSPWRGAEMIHFWLLAHRLLYGGNFSDAMETALLISDTKQQHQSSDVSGIIGDEELQAFIALAAFYSRKFGTCSRSLMKLESMGSIDEGQRAAYANMAVEIFTRHPPSDDHMRPAAGGPGSGQRDRRRSSVSKADRARELLNQPIAAESAKTSYGASTGAHTGARTMNSACLLSGRALTVNDNVTTCNRYSWDISLETHTHTQPLRATCPCCSRSLRDPLLHQD